MSDNLMETPKVCIDVCPDEEARGAVLRDKKWQPGQTLRVRFLDGDPIVQQKIEAIDIPESQIQKLHPPSNPS